MASRLFPLLLPWDCYAVHCTMHRMLPLYFKFYKYFKWEQYHELIFFAVNDNNNNNTGWVSGKFFSSYYNSTPLYREAPKFFFLLLVFLEFIIRTTNGINNYPRELIQSQSTDMQVIHTCSSTSFNQMHTTLHSVLTWNFSSKKIEYCCQLISMIPAAAPGTFRHRYIVNCSLTFPLFWWSFVEFLWKMRVKRRKRKEVKKSNNVGINIME